MKKFLFLLVFILFTVNTSCIDKEFENELKFVQKIIDNPYEIEQIIKSSEFYDSTYIHTGGHKFTSISNYLIEDKDYKVRIVNYYYSKWLHPNGKIIDSVKFVVVKCGDKFHVNFGFIVVNDKAKLLKIGVGY